MSFKNGLIPKGEFKMGTKNDPGQFDCYAKALPDEPMFVLLARDPNFYEDVYKWAMRRGLAIDCGERPQEDGAMVNEAIRCANAGQLWRRQNNGIWRR